MKKTPGPADYNNTSSSFRKHGGLFGHTKRYGMESIELSKVPGPGAYNILGRNKSCGVKFGTSRRIRESDGISLPGPGSYEVQDKTGGSKFTIPGRPSSSSTANGPGPGAYAPSVKKSNKGCRFPTARLGIEESQLKSFPGPGQYDPKVLCSNTYKCSPSWKYYI